VIKKRLSIIMFLGVLLTIFATTASADTSAAQNQRRYVRLTVDEETNDFHTYATTVGEFLETEEIYLSAKDILSLDLDEELYADEVTELWLRRSFFINIVIDGDEAFEYEVGPSQRVGHIIAELREEKGSDFSHDGFLNDVVLADSTLYLLSVTVREHIMTVRQPYYREVRVTRGLAPNEAMLLQEGIIGEITTVINVSYVGGVEINRVVESVTQTREPVSEILLVGDTVLDSPAPMNAGTIVSVDGTIGNGYEYVISKIMESTGYSAQQPGLSNYTASGHRAVRGVVAVDPSVIPLGTWLYIENYGRALASDTGGAIIGYKIDLCFDSIAEALQHGRRDVRVWILR